MISAGAVTLLQFFESDSLQYLIPSFQRSYMWNEDAWESLWRDLLDTFEAGENQTHFFGIITTKAIDLELFVVKFHKYLLIDGQQRLITICILLAAIRDTASSSDKQIAQFVNNLLFVSTSLLGIKIPQPKLVPIKSDKDSFVQVMQGEITDQTQIVKAYNYFASKLQDRFQDNFDHYHLIKALLQKFVIVNILIPSGEDPYPIVSYVNSGSQTHWSRKSIVTQDSDELRFLETQLANYRRFSQDLELMTLIASGESEQTEFKESICLNPYTSKYEIKMRDPIIKAIAAFMNSNIGGTLLIGVADDGSINGINKEYALVDKSKANWDGYSLFVGNLLNSTLQIENPFSFFNVERRVIDKKDICYIRIQPASAPVYINKKLYVRTGNQSVELQGPDLIDYVRRRWSKS